MKTNAQKLTSKKARRPLTWEAAFLAALKITGNVLRACQASQVDRRACYDHRGRHPDFAAAWDSALEESADVLEVEARRRAVDGVRKVVTHKGDVVFVWQTADGTIVPMGTPGAERVPLIEHTYSDVLLIFTLKGLRPEKYRENVKVLGGGPGGEELVKVLGGGASLDDI